MVLLHVELILLQVHLFQKVTISTLAIVMRFDAILREFSLDIGDQLTGGQFELIWANFQRPGVFDVCDLSNNIAI